MGTVRITKKSRNLLVMSGTWEVFRNIGPDVLFSWAVLFKSPLTGDYRKLMVQQQVFCDYYNKDTMMMPSIRNASNLPEPSGCPFPKGKYTIDNFEARVPEALPLGPGDYSLRVACISGSHQLMAAELKFTIE